MSDILHARTFHICLIWSLPAPMVALWSLILVQLWLSTQLMWPREEFGIWSNLMGISPYSLIGQDPKATVFSGLIEFLSFSWSKLASCVHIRQDSNFLSYLQLQTTLF